MLHAVIDHPVDCPSCGRKLTAEVPLEWGRCADGRRAPRYRVGDLVQWGSPDGGCSVPSWTVLPDGTANLGSPAESHVVVACRYAPHRCVACGCRPLVIVRIHRGCIVEVTTVLGDTGHWDHWVLGDGDDLTTNVDWVPFVQGGFGEAHAAGQVHGLVVTAPDIAAPLATAIAS